MFFIEGVHTIRVLLTFEERVQIETLISQRVPLTEIAKRLKRHRSTITREIRRTTEEATERKYPIGILKSMYRATGAQMQANKRARNAGRPSSLNQYSQKVLIKEIRNNHLTPSQVVAKHPKLFSNTTIIYNWINHNKIRGLSNEDLPMDGKRFKRGSNKRFLKFIRKNAVGSGIAQHYSINKRSESVNKTCCHNYLTMPSSNNS